MEINPEKPRIIPKDVYRTIKGFIYQMEFIEEYQLFKKKIRQQVALPYLFGDHVNKTFERQLNHISRMYPKEVKKFGKKKVSEEVRLSIQKMCHLYN